MLRKIITTLMLTLMIFSIYTIPSHASNEGLPYLIEPVLPENQDKNIDHYISVSPNSNFLKQELEFLVTNKTKKKQKINIKIFNAYTSPNGVIQYAPEGSQDSLIIDKKYEMQQYIRAPQSVELEGGESKIVRLKLDMTDIEGTILGAVAFQGDANTQTSKSKGITFEIKNEINSIYGIAINFPTEQDYEFKIGDPFLDPMPSYYAIRLPITLDSPLLLKDVEIKYEVYYKGEKLFFSKEEIDFAPMTKTNFSIPWKHDVIKNNGTYNLKGSLTYKNVNGEQKTIYFGKDFEVNHIKQNSIGPFNFLKVPTIEGFSNFWTLAALLSILLLLLIPLLWLIYKNKNKRYVLFSDNSTAPEIIFETDELFDKVRLEGKDSLKTKYKHIYKRIKNENNTIVYIKLKTIVNKD